MSLKILLVDDHTLFTEGLSLVLKSLDQAVTIAVAGDMRAAMTAAGEHNFDLILLDLNLPDIHGLDALEFLAQKTPTTPIVIVSGKDEEWEIRRAMASGAMGFIPKSMPGRVLLEAIRLILDGEKYIPPKLAGTTNGYYQGRNSSRFTKRQTEILTLLTRGRTNREIAATLNISGNTVEIHVSSILKNLGAHNRTEAAYRAIQQGYVEVME
ncbi:MAG: response regulator transcription factor [Alphaproteobacteria bacterium]|nr:response regulator transcription factor [Alphaproteobacteria bacterium]